MSTIPSNLARVPNAMISRIMLNTLNRTGRDLFNTQVQLSTGLAVNRPSDDALAAGTVSVLDDVIERRGQWLRNLQRGESVLNNLDAALGEASDLIVEAKGIAASQIGIGSDETTRENQAKVIDAMLNEMFSIANRKLQDLHLFGGDATGPSPLVELLGGMRYRGEGTGLAIDIGQSKPMKITLGGDEAFGAVSSRVKGNRDLDPAMTTSTRLLDLNGARGKGISLGSIDVVAGSPATTLTVDLSTAHTIGDVIATLNTAIQAVDAGATLAVNAAGNALEMSGNANAVTISDLGADATAADLGINQTFAAGGGPVGGQDVDPKLTELTPLADLTGITVPMGTIRLENAGQTRDLDLSGASTVRDVMTAVEALDIGIRVEIADTGDRLDFVNELSGGNMSIGEVSSSTSQVATELGVRSMAGWTTLSDFNDGRGVRIISGSVDPISGMPDPQADLDFRITLKDNSTVDVDLAGAVTVQDVIDRINGSTGGLPITAALAADGNGITISDGAVGVNPTSVTALNGSFAAEDLGIRASTSGAIIVGQDRATVAVDSVFTHLIQLRDALKADDETGITLASERFEADIGRLAEARAKVGVLSRRVSDSIVREEDLRTQDMALKSQFQDLDFTEAAIRFSALQQQLQAGLATAAQATSLTLLDFLR